MIVSSSYKRNLRFLLALSDADESGGDAAIQELVSKVRGVSTLD